jgi:hypothetical protein
MGSGDLASVKLEFFAPQYFGIFLHEIVGEIACKIPGKGQPKN